VTDEKRVLMKAIGCLLAYPDERLGELLDSVEKVLRDLPPSLARERLMEALHGLAGMDPIALREEYTRLFDFNPGTTLELTYHKWGDARDRGAALAGLQRMYREAGWKPATRELPDFLPLVLGLLALAPEKVCSRVLDEYRHELSGLADRVAAASRAYGPILEVLRQVALE
jgi:nitrate reductase molybdenum cofactor assembly chaperone NarJ/NarW